MLFRSISGDARDAETQNWHEAFGVSLAALEKVAAQLASNYPTEVRSPGAPASEARPAARLGSDGPNLGAEPSAKRPRLIDDQERHTSRGGST